MNIKHLSDYVFPILPEFSVFCKNRKRLVEKVGTFFSASTEKNTCCVYFLKFYKFYANQMQFAKISDKMKLSEGKFGQVKGKRIA